MAFVVAENKRIWWPVQVLEPVDGGKVEAKEISIFFEIEDPDQWAEDDESILEVLKRIIKGWKDVNKQDQSPLEFNETNLAALLKLSYVRVALWDAYNGEVIPGAPAKN